MSPTHTQHAQEIQHLLDALDAVDDLMPGETVTQIGVGRFHVIGPRSETATESQIRQGETGLYWSLTTTKCLGNTRHTAQERSDAHREAARRKARTDIVKAFLPVIAPVGRPDLVWAIRAEDADDENATRAWISLADAAEHVISEA